MQSLDIGVRSVAYIDGHLMQTTAPSERRKWKWRICVVMSTNVENGREFCAIKAYKSQSETDSKSQLNPLLIHCSPIHLVWVSNIKWKLSPIHSNSVYNEHEESFGAFHRSSCARRSVLRDRRLL